MVNFCLPTLHFYSTSLDPGLSISPVSFLQQQSPRVSIVKSYIGNIFMDCEEGKNMRDKCNFEFCTSFLFCTRTHVPQSKEVFLSGPASEGNIVRGTVRAHTGKCSSRISYVGHPEP
jgi:hypothetical protein